MAESFLFKLFRITSESNAAAEQEDDNRTEQNETEVALENGTTIHDVVNFVAELQSYYYNDICKMQADLISQGFSQNRVNFMNRKIDQDSVALSQIDEILELIKKNEKEYQSVFRKSIYSFYNEIENGKIEEVQKKILSVVTKLYEVNTKPELDSVILGRIEKYKKDWKITGQLEIPKNYNAIVLDIADEEAGIFKYRFYKYHKMVEYCESDIVLSAKRLEAIRNMEFQYENESHQIPTSELWVYASSVTRGDLNFMRRTCIIGNDLKNTMDDEEKGKLYFDVVPLADFEQYVKGILQILLTKRNHAVISIIVPTRNMISAVGRINREENRVEICQRLYFCLNERNSLFEENLLTARIDRRDIPETLYFLPYRKYKRSHF